MCACGNRGIKKVASLWVCARCARIESMFYCGGNKQLVCGRRENHARVGAEMEPYKVHL